MLKKRRVFLILVIFLIILFTVIMICVSKKEVVSYVIKDTEIFSSEFDNVQSKYIDVDKFYVYGRSLNISGRVSGVSKDNFENARLYLTDR